MKAQDECRQMSCCGLARMFSFLFKETETQVKAKEKVKKYKVERINIYVSV